MKIILSTYFATLLTFCLLDVVYLGGFAKNFFDSQLGPGILLAKPVISAGAAFYLIYTAGVVYLLALPAAGSRKYLQTAIRGAVFGFVAYCTYDLTNMATLTGWNWSIVCVDVTWGTIATAIGTTVGTYVASATAR
jgi:uncharacterized membrane protein